LFARLPGDNQQHANDWNDPCFVQWRWKGTDMCIDSKCVGGYRISRYKVRTLWHHLLTWSSAWVVLQSLLLSSLPSCFLCPLFPCPILFISPDLVSPPSPYTSSCRLFTTLNSYAQRNPFVTNACSTVQSFTCLSCSVAAFTFCIRSCFYFGLKSFLFVS
jgi:hypothetical protein